MLLFIHIWKTLNRRGWEENFIISSDHEVFGRNKTFEALKDNLKVIHIIQLISEQLETTSHLIIRIQLKFIHMLQLRLEYLETTSHLILRRKLKSSSHTTSP